MRTTAHTVIGIVVLISVMTGRGSASAIENTSAPQPVVVLYHHGIFPPKASLDAGRVLVAIWNNGEIISECSECPETHLYHGTVRRDLVAQLLDDITEAGFWETEFSRIVVNREPDLSITVAHEGSCRTLHWDGVIRELEDSVAYRDELEQLVHAFKSCRRIIESIVPTESAVLRDCTRLTTQVEDLMTHDSKRQVAQMLRQSYRPGALVQLLPFGFLSGQEIEVNLQSEPLALAGGAIEISFELRNKSTIPKHFLPFSGKWRAGPYYDQHDNKRSWQGVWIYSRAPTEDDIPHLLMLQAGASRKFDVRVEVPADIPNPVKVYVAAYHPIDFHGTSRLFLKDVTWERSD